MRKQFLLFSLFCLFLCDCSFKQNESKMPSDIETIPITDFDTTYGKLSDFAEEVKMIPLEFTDKSILGEIKKVVMSNKFIFVMERTNKEGIYTFDHTGKFLYRIGSRGQGPEEFVDLFDFSINEEDELIYLFDQPRTRILVFTFDNKFIKDIPMNYYASRFEYQNGLFYLYKEHASYGTPLYSLVIKDQNGDLVDKYYPMAKDAEAMYIHDCIFRKRENGILFAQDLNDSVFVLSGSKLNPRYYIDYKDRTMSKEDRMDIKFHVRPPISIILEKKTLGGITDIFEINDKVFIKNVNIIIPMLTVYDKKKKEVNTFQYLEDDFLFIATEHPIGQYKNYLLSLKDQESIQNCMDHFDTWIKEGDLDKNKANELKKMIEEKLPDRNTGECNPVLFMIKVKK